MIESKHVCTCYTDPYQLDPVCLEHNQQDALIAQRLAVQKNGDEYWRSSIGYARVLRNEVAWAVPVVREYIAETIRVSGQHWVQASIEVGAFHGALKGLERSIERLERHPSTDESEHMRGVVRGLQMAQEMFSEATKHAIEQVDKEKVNGGQ